MSRSSLRLRLLVAAAAFVLAALALSAIGLTYLFERHVEHWIDAELSTRIDQLIAGVGTGSDGELSLKRSPDDPRFKQPLSGLYWQVNVEPAGPVLRSRSLWDFEIALPAEADIDDKLHEYSVPGPDGQALYLLQRRVELPARLGGTTARFAVAVDRADLTAAVHRFAGALAPFLLLLALLLMAASWAQVTVGLRPLAAMRRKLAAVSAGAAPRLGKGFPDEVQPLAHEIDTLLEARDRQVEKARTRAADLAHGLKTPLQLLGDDAQRLKMKGESEIADDIEDIANAMRRHVERELTRARSGAGNANAAAANVESVAQRVVRVIERTPEGRRLSWTVDVPAGLMARIDPDDLTEALGNLAENAARHARDAVSVTARAAEGLVAVSVIDDGQGIPADRIKDVLQRGGRLDSLGSAGLGLAIIGDIADAWGGTLSFEPAQAGCHITLRIPAARLPARSA